MGVGDVDDLVSARTHDIGIVLAAALLEARRSPAAEALVVVVTDDRGIALAHDDAAAGFLDHQPAAGFRALAPLRPQLIDGHSLLHALRTRRRPPNCCCGADGATPCGGAPGGSSAAAGRPAAAARPSATWPAAAAGRSAAAARPSATWPAAAAGRSASAARLSATSPAAAAGRSASAARLSATPAGCGGCDDLLLLRARRRRPSAAAAARSASAARLVGAPLRLLAAARSAWRLRCPAARPAVPVGCGGCTICFCCAPAAVPVGCGGCTICFGCVPVGDARRLRRLDDLLRLRAASAPPSRLREAARFAAPSAGGPFAGGCVPFGSGLPVCGSTAVGAVGACASTIALSADGIDSVPSAMPVCGTATAGNIVPASKA